ncbi:hypothetical protein EV178_004265 [Coemansia sp. RSA 1646]|nr:hypothetical protein EV178_004265 [Coemansia sp. RSA 1646]KAJ1770837.1 hypothetical protein LPJ74_002823 [Coemansia sp. RSA 1843]KAJ2211746.1 hypothetical protein EV179_005247 [Coemansia sp. RSA 487]
MDTSIITSVSQSIVECIATSAVTEVQAFGAPPTRIVHPALTESVTEAEEYEVVASLSTAFTLSESEPSSKSPLESSEPESGPESGPESESDKTEAGFGLDESSGAILEPSNVGAASTRSAQIFCLKKNCSQNRDWLTSTPNAAAGWATGGIAIVIGIVLFVPTIVWRNTDFLDAVFALAELCIALFLRAAISTTKSNQDIIYKASLFFNHHAAIELILLLAIMVARLHAHYNPGAASRQVVWAAVARFISICLAVMVLVGVLLMFGSNVDSSAPGIHLMQAVTFFILATALVLAAFAMKMTFNVGVWFYKKHFAVLFISFFLVALWATYMSARTLVPLDNVARDSEVMFYLLNVLPLALIGAVFIALRAPLLYNFEMTAHWKCEA